MTDVVVVSVFGRGHWIAWELADRGLKVQLIDLSESLGRWTAEDWEGPFGFTKSEALSASQLARIQEEEDLEPVHQGWTFWVPDGPLDTQGPLAAYFAQGPLNFNSQTRHFSEAWPWLLSASLSSTVFYEHWQALRSQIQLDVFAPFFVHRVSRRGFQNSLEWCRKKGVEVFESASLEDIQTEARDMTGVEIRSQFNGVLQGQQYVWCLASQETQKLQTKVAQKLFPSGVLESEWSWIRYRFSCEVGAYQKILPLHAVIVGDLHLPWTHNNLLILQKTVKAQHFDLWMRLPTHHRFQREYLKEMAQGALKTLKAKMPFSDIQILEMPQDYLYEFAELGPALFPVYNFEKRSRLTTRIFKNVYYDGPEQWSSLDWNGRFHHQNKISEAIKTWQADRVDQEAKKKGSRDRSLHPS